MEWICEICGNMEEDVKQVYEPTEKVRIINRLLRLGDDYDFINVNLSSQPNQQALRDKGYIMGVKFGREVSPRTRSMLVVCDWLWPFKGLRLRSDFDLLRFSPSHLYYLPKLRQDVFKINLLHGVLVMQETVESLKVPVPLLSSFPHVGGRNPAPEH
jgi:hypothetical protein